MTPFCFLQNFTSEIVLKLQIPDLQKNPIVPSYRFGNGLFFIFQETMYFILTSFPRLVILSRMLSAFSQKLTPLEEREVAAWY